MTTIVTRAGKGSPLTHTEVDTNFTNLNTNKLETAAIPLGTLQAPSVSFLSDSDTGIFCPQGGNSLAVATGGQYAITCTSTQAVGIKTANPQKALHVAGPTRVGADDATDAFLEIGEGATGNRTSYIDIVGDTTYTDYGLRVIRNNTGANATSELKHRGTGALNITTQEAAPIVFNTTNSPRLTITSGGLVGIGTSAPSSLLHLVSSGQPKITVADDGGRTLQIKAPDSSANPGFVGTTTNHDFLLQAGITAGGLNIMTFNTAGSERVRITDLGRVGIGATTVDELLHLKGSSTTNTTLKIESSATGAERSSVHFFNNAISRGRIGGSNDFDGLTLDSSTTEAAASIRFRTGGTSLSPKMTLDSSGRLLVGTSTASGSEKLNVTYAPADTGVIINTSSSFSANSVLMEFKANGTTGGSIVFTNNGTSTAYVTSSDYRIKENIAELENGIARVLQLKPKQFNFIADPNNTVDGFIAHEAQEVVPQAVTGTKDKVDDNGNPVYQGIDQSKLVPLLTAALQEAIGRIEQLESTVKTLQGA